MSAYSARRDPKTYYLDENEYRYVDDHDAFFHSVTKFWYVIDHKLFWSSQENQWYSYDNATQVWQSATPPTRMQPGPWNPKQKKAAPSRTSNAYQNRASNQSYQQSRTASASSVPQIGRNLGETHKVVDVATLLFDLKPQLARFTDKKEKLSFLVKRIREQFKVDEAEAKRLYQEARKQFKSSNQSQLQRVAAQRKVQQTQLAQQRIQAAPTLLNTRIAQPIVQSRIVPHVVPVRAAPVLIPQPMLVNPFTTQIARTAYIAPAPIAQQFRPTAITSMYGTWSDKKGDQFWHIVESDGIFVGVGTWKGYQHWDCVLRGFKKPNGEISMAINYSFRKESEAWASNHIAYWKGTQIGDKLGLKSKQSSQSLELERVKHGIETKNLNKRKIEVLKEMKTLLDTVTSTSVGQQKLNDAVTMLRLLHIPDDAWVQEKWSLRAQQAFQKAKKTSSKRGDDLSDSSKKKKDNQTINRQLQKQFIEINDSHSGYACMVCAIKFKDPGGRLRLCHHVLHDKTHKALVEPFLHEAESHSRIPSLMTNYDKHCRLCKKKVLKNQVFGHVHGEEHFRALDNYIPPISLKKKDSHTKKRKASSHGGTLPSAKRRVQAKALSDSLKHEVILETMFNVRESWCKSGSRLKYWSGCKIKSVLSDLQEEFPELSSWSMTDLERLVNTVTRLSVNPDGTKIMYNNHMDRKEYFQEMIVARMWRRYSDDCRTKQEKLEWRGVDTKTLYRDKDVKDAAKDLNLRKEDRFKEYVYANRKSLLGIHSERDTDQKNVKDFTVWVRFEETRRTKNYKKKHLQSEMERIKKKVRPATQCRQEFKKGISDSMISKDRITLKDTFTLRRIETPAKAKSCKHTQCFDLGSYLKMKLFQRDVYKMKKGSSGERVKVERWKCPVCNKTAKRGDLYVDGFWQQILNDPATHDYDSVFVMPDCTYQVEEVDQGEASESEDEEEHPSKKPAQNENAIISLLSDDEDDEPPPPPPPKVVPTPKSPPKKPAPKPKEVPKATKSVERNKHSNSRDRSRRDRRRRSRSPDRYRKEKAASSEKNKSTSATIDKEADYEFLTKILQNINLEAYKDSLISKKYGLSDCINAITRNEMKVISSVVTERTDRMLLVQHIFSLIEDPEALMFCIGKPDAPMAAIFIGKTPTPRED